MKMKNCIYHSICLNLCSFCNLRCDWCYNQSDKQDFLSYTVFEDFYYKIIEENINEIILIGGEPTIHPNFISILNVLSNKQVHLISNGLMFSKEDFLNECIKTRKNVKGHLTGLQSISISLKGFDKASYLLTTRTDKFESLCQAISNLNNCGIPVTYSYIFANDINQYEIERFLFFLKEYKISNIIISDTRPYINDNRIIDMNMVNNLDKLLYYLEENGIIVYFRPNHPLCEYSSELIAFVLNNKKLISSCAVKKCNGYFFTTSLELIPCNELYKIILGRYKLDFNDFDDLNSLWNSRAIQNFYQKLSGYPQLKCIKCNMWEICGGSCILHWIKEGL